MTPLPRSVTAWFCCAIVAVPFLASDATLTISTRPLTALAGENSSALTPMFVGTVVYGVSMVPSPNLCFFAGSVPGKFRLNISLRPFAIFAALPWFWNRR